MPFALRALEPADAPALHALCTHPLVARDLLGHDPSQPPHLFRTRLEAIAPANGSLVGAFESGELLGAAGLELTPMARRRHAGHAWVAVAPSAQRRGVGRALLTAIAESGDRWFHLDRIELSVPAGAEAALHLATSLGFAQEVRRRQALWRDGTMADVEQLAWVRPGATSGPLAPVVPARPAERWPVQLRAAVPDDAAAIAEIQGEPDVRRGTLQVPFTQVRFWRQRLETNDPAMHHLAVAERDGRVVGLAGLHGLGLLRSAHVWSLGMMVRTEAQGRGVGAALFRYVLGWADSWLGAWRVELDVYTDNTRAISLYESHGFVREGTKRCDVWRDGSYADCLAMARLR